MTIGDRYTLRAAIGNGGMGTVWRAADTLLRRDVAVKEVAPPPGVSTAERDAMYERMMREARAAAVISHPSVVQVYDVVTDGDRPWIVMELLDARSLADMVMEDGPLGPRAVAKIGVAIVGALEMAHAAGVLHRDVKPANVLICSDGRPVLTDFGVARIPTDRQLTTPGMVLGSPHFISPERAMGKSFGPASDLFSLGVTLYAAVEGRPPFDKGDPIATMHSVVEDPPLPPERAGVLTEVICGLLEKEPDRRWDAARARQALRDLLAGPLASQPSMFPTDPYSVVPTQRSTLQPPPAAPPLTKVGGRALLPPTPANGATLHRRPQPHTPPRNADDLPETGEWRPTGVRRAASRTAPPPAVRPAPSRLSGLAAAASQIGAQSWERVRRMPRNLQLAGVAGLVTVILVGIALLRAGGSGDDPDSGANQVTDALSTEASAGEPPFEVQGFAGEINGRGITVNLPARWSATESTDIRVDYADPDNQERRLRLLVEGPTEIDAAQFITNIAEQTIQGRCPEPYRRVDLDAIEVAGARAAKLEYTCGNDGDSDARHAYWATVIHERHAYSILVSLPLGQADDLDAIFEEVVRSFQFT